LKASPFHRDPLKELAAACRKNDVKLGFYYSQGQDWNNGGSVMSGRKWDPAQQHSMDDYIDTVAVPQLKEILTGYGEFPAVLWFDTPSDINRDRAAKLAVVLKLKPGIIVNNRLGAGYRGDTETPEQTIPATGFKDRDWETCMTMNDTVVFTERDSGTAGAPVVYSGVPGEEAFISGGSRLQLAWTPYRDGMMQAWVPAGLDADQLFVNGRRQQMAI